MQTEKSQSAVPAASILILLPASGTSLMAAAPMQDGEPRILGLGLMERTALAARRAGYHQIYFLSRNQSVVPGIMTIPHWTSLASVFATHQPARLIIAPATIVAEKSWLERSAAMQIEPAAWAAVPHRIVMLSAAIVPDALSVLKTDGGAHDLDTVQGRLTRHFGSPAQFPTVIDPIVVTGSTNVGFAEQRLLRGLVKETDGFMARNVERPISLQIVRSLAYSAITPNQITLLSVAVGLAGAPFFLSTLWLWQTVGAVLFLAHSILDGCDGELARLRFQESRFGGVIDFWGDNVVHIVIFACMAVGWSLSADALWPLLLGAAAAISSLGSAWFVYWQVMRAKDDSGPLFTSVSAAPGHKLARLLDAASRRDFIYLVLILALFGKSNWFLLLAAMGAPIFFVLLVFLAASERFSNRPTISNA